MSIDEFTKRLELSGNFKPKKSSSSSVKNVQKITIEFDSNILEINLTNKD
jgi:hypothetical protein